MPPCRARGIAASRRATATCCLRLRSTTGRNTSRASLPTTVAVSTVPPRDNARSIGHHSPARQQQLELGRPTPLGRRMHNAAFLLHCASAPALHALLVCPRVFGREIPLTPSGSGAQAITTHRHQPACCPSPKLCETATASAERRANVRGRDPLRSPSVPSPRATCVCVLHSSRLVACIVGPSALRVITNGGEGIAISNKSPRLVP